MPLDDPDEMFVQVTADDQFVGLVSRRQAHTNHQIIHRAVCVLVFNDHHQLLLQLRSKHKDLHPGYWALSCAGHVTGYDSYEDTAQRELKEELDIEATIHEITKAIFRIPEETEVVKVFGCTVTDTHFQYDPTEVERVEWVKINTLESFTLTYPFTPMDLDLLKRLDFLKNYVPA